jgi:hypothetical protein
MRMGGIISRRTSLKLIGSAAVSPLLGCAAWIREDEVGEGTLSGRVLVEWIGEDQFVYRATNNPLRFKPSFMNADIVPKDIFTDGGSIPRVFWVIPGLSPWGLGPAYIIHDWLFQIHRCGLPEVGADLTFRQSALVLAEVGKALIASGLINHDMLDEIVWGVSTRLAENLWDDPKTPEECKPPPTIGLRAGIVQNTVADFVIPAPRR